MGDTEHEERPRCACGKPATGEMITMPGHENDPHTVGLPRFQCNECWQRDIVARYGPIMTVEELVAEIKGMERAKAMIERLRQEDEGLRGTDTAPPWPRE